MSIAVFVSQLGVWEDGKELAGLFPTPKDTKYS